MKSQEILYSKSNKNSVCGYISTHTSHITHIYTHPIYIYVCVCVCVCVCVYYVCVYIYMYTRVCVYVYIYTHIYIHIDIKSLFNKAAAN